VQRAAQGHAPRRALSAKPTLTPTPAPTTMAASTLPIRSEAMPGSAAASSHARHVPAPRTAPDPARPPPPPPMEPPLRPLTCTHRTATRCWVRRMPRSLPRARSRPTLASASARTMNQRMLTSPRAPLTPRRPDACGQRVQARGHALSRRLAVQRTHRMFVCGGAGGRRSRRKLTHVQMQPKL
jgi:hypothetical protein